MLFDWFIVREQEDDASDVLKATTFFTAPQEGKRGFRLATG